MQIQVNKARKSTQRRGDGALQPVSGQGKICQIAPSIALHGLHASIAVVTTQGAVVCRDAARHVRPA